MVELKSAIAPLCESSIVDRGSWEIRRAAAVTLGQIAADKLNGPNRQAMAALYNRLGDTTAQVRLACARSIIHLGQPADAADIEALKNALVLNVKRDPYNLVKIWSRVALMRLDEKFVNDENLGEIAKGLAERDQATQLAAAEALGMVGRSAGSQLSALIAATDSDDPYVVAAAVQAMGYIGHPKAIEPLTKLKDGHKEGAIRFAAEDAIARINGEKK
jgi:HEAT repeat protein